MLEAEQVGYLLPRICHVWLISTAGCSNVPSMDYLSATQQSDEAALTQDTLLRNLLNLDVYKCSFVVIISLKSLCFLMDGTLLQAQWHASDVAIYIYDTPWWAYLISDGGVIWFYIAPQKQLLFPLYPSSKHHGKLLAFLPEDIFIAGNQITKLFHSLFQTVFKYGINSLFSKCPGHHHCSTNWVVNDKSLDSGWFLRCIARTEIHF